MQRRSEAFIRQVLAEAATAPSVEQIRKKYGVSKRTFYDWRKKYGSIPNANSGRGGVMPTPEEIDAAVDVILRAEQALERLRAGQKKR